MHAEQAIKVARETGWNLDELAAEREWSGVAIGPVGRHRDSEALDRSNYVVILRDLTERFGDAVSDVRFGHWAVGWVEEIVWDAGREDVRDAAQTWRDALDDYPVADEEHWSETEWAENHPDGDDLCYSDDPDCGCDRESA
jgi:hypothetical protein